jgi:hypothetical protein
LSDKVYQLLAHGVFGFEYLSFKNLTHIPLSGKLGSCALMKISTKFLSNLQYLTKVDLSLYQISVIEAGPQAYYLERTKPLMYSEEFQ